MKRVRRSVRVAAKRANIDVPSRDGDVANPVIEPTPELCSSDGAVVQQTSPLLSMEPFYYLASFMNNSDKAKMRLLCKDMKHRVDEQLRIKIIWDEIAQDGDLICCNGNGPFDRAERLLKTPFELTVRIITAQAKNVNLTSEELLDVLLKAVSTTSNVRFKALDLTLDIGDYSQEKYNALLEKICYSKVLSDHIVLHMTSKQVQCIKKLVGKLFPVIKEEDLETDERRPIFLKNKIDNTVLFTSDPGRVVILFFHYQKMPLKNTRCNCLIWSMTIEYYHDMYAEYRALWGK